jgi:Domain of unknown function (DUF4920)
VIARFISALFAALFTLAACSRSDGRSEQVSTAPSSVPNARPMGDTLHPAPKGTLALGEPITSRLVPLADIARSPTRYENQVVTTAGRVTSVCQEMGCWMEIQDESGQAHVRMHGHTFFVPKTAAGHIARVQAKVLRGSGEQCDESPPPQHAVANIELDATGVELD